MAVKPGKFIVVEGLEGAGKTSAIDVVCKSLSRANIHYITTREPGGTAMAEAIRDCVKKNWKGEIVLAETELMLMYAARLQLIYNVIKPNLEKGLWVIGDRHDLSTQAYQGGGGQIPRTILDPIREVALKGFTPDITLYLDIKPEIGLARARGRGELDRIELNDIQFFERTRHVYLSACDQDASIVKIDAGQSMEMVHADIQGELESLLSVSIS